MKSQISKLQEHIHGHILVMFEKKANVISGRPRHNLSWHSFLEIRSNVQQGVDIPAVYEVTPLKSLMDQRVIDLQEHLETSLRGQQRHDVEGQSRLQLISSQKAKNEALSEAFKEAQAWSEDQFQQWAKIQAQKEADNLALQMYWRQDEVILKQMSLELSR